jgi:hypothetical protein
MNRLALVSAFFCAIAGCSGPKRNDDIPPREPVTPSPIVPSTTNGDAGAVPPPPPETTPPTDVPRSMNQGEREPHGSIDRSGYRDPTLFAQPTYPRDAGMGPSDAGAADAARMDAGRGGDALVLNRDAGPLDGGLAPGDAIAPGGDAPPPPTGPR